MEDAGDDAKRVTAPGESYDLHDVRDVHDARHVIPRPITAAMPRHTWRRNINAFPSSTHDAGWR
jgi:hypothetical protein